ncbi:probable meiosis-specific protein ASY1 [Coccomyxa sp. Obi]|nr:probable meiosis-specific protein ASY1 [Coccomyxa sp. Obi]
MLQAVDQAQHQAEITSVESLELVRCLLRVSVFHTCYLRGIFPESSFKEVRMAGLDGLGIKVSHVSAS